MVLYQVALAELPACRPFRVHRKVTLPTPPSFSENNLFANNWEDSLVDKISAYDKTFKKIYWGWKNSEAFVPPSDLQPWLQCLLYYVQIDTDGDGLPDWSVQSDEKPARILYPFDTDIDGDGIENILDPDPFQKNIFPIDQNAFPKHLESSTKEVLHWQNELWKHFRILAIEHTTNHSSYVLKEFFYLLKQMFPGKLPLWINEIKYLYAFQNHDDKNNIAAFHFAAHAISIGGSNYYKHQLVGKKRIEFLSTLAHEIGHAFLLGAILPKEFQDLCEKFGWRDVFENGVITSFNSPPFFREHPDGDSVEKAKKNNFVSDYSYTNAHEWFAEAFAESILMQSKIIPSRSSNTFDRWLTYNLYSK